MADTATACTIKPPVTTRLKKVAVNGADISRDAIARETQNHPAAKPIDAWQAAARALVIRELLLQEARRLGLQAEPATDEEGRRETDDEAVIRAVIEREVVTPEPGEAECLRYFEANRKRFRSPALFEVAHILLGCKADTQEADLATSARTLLDLLGPEPKAFEALARQYSDCPSREVGGNLGQIGPGQTVPEFEAALAEMIPGSVHPEPVRTRYGLHIVRLDRRIAGRDLPFEIARPIIASYLSDHVQRMAQRQYISQLAGRASIEGVALDSATSPLVQ